MKVAVIGSREYTNKEFIYDRLNNLFIKKPITCIISGGAKGADTIGEQWANDNKIDKLILIPDWNKHGKSAGFKRNIDIVKSAEIVLAFWDGISKGTKHSIDLAISSKTKIITFINGEISKQWSKTEY